MQNGKRQGATSDSTSFSCEKSFDAWENWQRVRFGSYRAPVEGASAGPCPSLDGVRRDDERGAKLHQSEESKRLKTTSDNASLAEKGREARGSSSRGFFGQGSPVSSDLFFGVPSFETMPGGYNKPPYPNRQNCELETFGSFETPRNLPSPEQFVDVTCICDPYACFAGFDGGCRATFAGAWNLDAWEAFSGYLATLEVEHNARREPVVCPLFEGQTWSFRGAGRGEIHTFGDQNKGLRWCLERGGVRLFFNVNIDDLGLAPSGEVAVGVIFGERLFRGGVSLFPIADMVRELLGQLGFIIKAERVQRVDFQVTTDRFSIDDVRKFEYEGLICSRGRYDDDKKADSFSRGTLYWGRTTSKVRLRIYDKYGEARATRTKDMGEKLRYILNALGNDWLVTLKPLTRVEFEIRRGLLREFNVETFDDLRRVLPSLIDYLVGDWFRILAPEAKNSKIYGNTRRAEVSSDWAIIANVFREYARVFSSSDEPAIRVTRRKRDRTSEGLPDPRASEDFAVRASAVYLMSRGYAIDEGRDVRQMTLRDFLLEMTSLYQNRRDGLVRYIERKGGGFPRFRSFYDFDYQRD